MARKKQISEGNIPASELLARIVMGSVKADVAFPAEKKTPISLKVEPDLYKELEFFRSKSGKTMTDLVQMLLWIGINDVKAHMELDGQLEIPEVQK